MTHNIHLNKCGIVSDMCTVVADMQKHHRNPCIFKKMAVEELSTVVSTMFERVHV